VKAAAEKAKTRLSTHSETMVTVRDALLVDGSTTRLEMEITRDDLERLVDPLIGRTLQICDAALAEAKLDKQGLTAVLLVGGQTRMPLVRRRVEEHFGKAPRTDLNPDEAVALGAGSLPHLASVGQVRFSDVLSMSIGVAVDAQFRPVIPRNTPVPHTAKLNVSVPRAKLATYSLGVWQGDEAELRKNELLGALRLPTMAAADTDPVPLEITFALSADCLLTVQVTNLSTRESERVLLISRD